jgi:hypothetical protein
MTNMSYCRFNNTLGDLRDCEEHMRDKLSTGRHEESYDSEFTKRQKLIEACIRIASEYGIKDDDGVLTGDAEDMSQYEKAGEDDDDDEFSEDGSFIVPAKRGQ